MRRAIISLLISVTFLTGCIHNDLPYPVVVPNITSMTVQDAVKVDIDYETQVVTVYVSETTDIRNVVIQSVGFDIDFTRPSINLLGVHDLSSPLKFKLSTYQDYDWTIRAVRPIERYFTVAGQIGSSVIDEYNCRVIANVSEGTNISKGQKRLMTIARAILRKSPIIIHHAIASCGCTVPDYTFDPIMPGKKGKITVTSDGTTRRPGVFRKSITVHNNGRQTPIRIYIEGEMIASENAIKEVELISDTTLYINNTLE